MIGPLTALASVALPAWNAWQRATGRIAPETAENRIGRATAPHPGRPVIWVHAASLGELAAVRPVLAHLAARRPGHALLITANNPRALEVAAQWPEVPHIGQVAPLDLPRALRRFLRHWQPVAFINVEAELWPNRFAALARCGIPAIFLNARLSDRSLANVRRLGLGAMQLDHFGHFFAQSEETAENLRALGLPPAKIEVTPNLKALVHLPPPHPLLRGLPRAETLLAASTHAPEEAEILQAFRALRRRHPALRLLLSPRHPRRAPEVAELVRRIGLRPAMLSALSDLPDRETVAIVDGLGIQPALYWCAAVSFIGGSLPEGIGGHTPYEPIRAGSAIVTGPNVANFAAEYEALEQGGGCIVARGDLAAALERALEEAPALAARAARALPAPPDPETLFERIAERLELG